MSSRTWKVLAVCAVVLVFSSLSGCVQGGSSLEGDFARELLFFEQWVRVEGEAGPPYVCIDFPTYRFDEEKKMLVSFQGIFGDGEGKVNLAVCDLIVGEGTALSGSAGSGAVSDLKAVDGFPFTMGYGALVIRDMRDDGTLILEPLNEELVIFDLVFPNPIPGRAFALEPGEQLEYRVTRTFLLAGRLKKLTVTVVLRSTFLDRGNCINGTWGMP